MNIKLGCITGIDSVGVFSADNVYKYSKQSVDDVNIIVILYIIYTLYVKFPNTWYCGGFPFSDQILPVGD